MGRVLLTSALLAITLCIALLPCAAEALTVRVSGYLPIGFTIGGVAVMVSLVFGEASMQAKNEPLPPNFQEPPDNMIVMSFPDDSRDFASEDGITLLRW